MLSRWRKSCIVRCRAERFMFIKVMEKQSTTTTIWKILNVRWTDAFSDVTEVILSILIMSVDVMPDRSCCHRAAKSLFPGCVNEI